VADQVSDDGSVRAGVADQREAAPARTDDQRRDEGQHPPSELPDRFASVS
jgi:hypothetical protein